MRFQNVVKPCSVQFHENPFNSSLVVSCVHTYGGSGRTDEAIPVGARIVANACEGYDAALRQPQVA
jgi:hypothetical protein